ncbi:MAG: MotA/TolQ/ExbB proton channel family protein [Planctomyces sp.]|jgi:biopolymer transport protein ExbB
METGFRLPNLRELAPWLEYASSHSTIVIIAAAVLHFFIFFVLWLWYIRDLRAIAVCLDDFTRGLRYRSILGRSASLSTQIDAFVEDINDVLADPSRHADRVECLRRMHILDEKRSYLDSLSFETVSHTAYTMIEAYPLAGVLGTILGIGAALQQQSSGSTTTAINSIVSRFGDGIWSTFAGLSAGMMLMFVNSILETRFSRLTSCRAHVREMVAKAKRELGMSASSLQTEKAT